MKGTICGADCTQCTMKKMCKGCTEKECFIASYITTGGEEKFLEFRKKLLEEFNELNIPGMSEVKELYPLVGRFVNLEYRLPNGTVTKFLDDESVYLGNQLECEFGSERCYGIVAGPDFLLVSEYGENGTEPEIVMYKRR